VVFALGGAYDVDDALEDVEHLGIVERAWIDSADVVEDLLLALGLVDGKGAIALELADSAGCLSPLADEADELLVQFIDFLTPVGDLHVDSSLQIDF